MNVIAERTRGLLATDGWRRTGELLHDDTLLRDAITAYGDTLRAPSRQVASALAFKAYSWAVIEPVVTAWLTRRRVPDFSVALTSVRFGADGCEVAMTTERASVLADDPLARAPGVIVVPSERALLDALRRTLIEGHLAPAVEAFRRIRGGGSRPLWGSVAQQLCYPATVAETLDPRAAVDQLLSTLSPDIADLVEVAELNEDGRWRPALIRRTCCYYYTVPAGEVCTTCCLLTDADRDRRAAAVGAQWRRTFSR
jgi:ferric iron reductase protein FhuF